MTKNGAKNKKQEEILSIPHILNDLIPFFEAHPEAVLDGEICNIAYLDRKQKIKELANKKELIDIEEHKKFLRFYIYDGYNFNNLTKEFSYKERKEFIDDGIFKKYAYIGYVLSLPCRDEETLIKNTEILTKDGQKKLFLRNLNSPYFFGKNTNFLKIEVSALKKKFDKRPEKL